MIWQWFNLPAQLKFFFFVDNSNRKSTCFIFYQARLAISSVPCITHQSCPRISTALLLNLLGLFDQYGLIVGKLDGEYHTNNHFFQQANSLHFGSLSINVGHSQVWLIFSILSSTVNISLPQLIWIHQFCASCYLGAEDTHREPGLMNFTYRLLS